MENEELTAEQAHYAAMETFVCDVRNIRFKETHANWATINDFLIEHSLDVTAENLNFAFAALCTDGLLELMPLGHAAPPQPPQPEPTPTPAAQPAPVVPIKAKTFAMYRNGKAIEGVVRSL